jgi:hypothetical protein
LATTQSPSPLKTILLVAGMLIFSNELLSFVTTNDTLILDGQVIYLDQDTLSDVERQQHAFDSDYRKIRKKGIWGLEANTGTLTISNTNNVVPIGLSSLYSLSPDFKKRSWGIGSSLMAYYHFQDHLALRTGIEYNQIEWKSMHVENIKEWNVLDIFESSFNTTGLQAFYRVLVDSSLGLYELDTMTVNPALGKHRLQMISIPVMAAFHLSSPSKRYRTPNVLMMEMGAVYFHGKILSPAMTALTETQKLESVEGLNNNWNHWSMRAAITWKRMINKKGLNALFLVSRLQMDWPPRSFQQYGWSWKLPNSYLTFGILWERGKSLHSLNN